LFDVIRITAGTSTCSCLRCLTTVNTCRYVLLHREHMEHRSVASCSSQVHTEQQNVFKWCCVITLPRSTVFGRPFVKRFALCYMTVVSLSVCLSSSVLSVTLMYCGQTVGWINMKLGMQVGLSPGHIAHICCGQMAEWIKMPLDMKVGLSPGDIVLNGDPAPPPLKAGGAPQFSVHVYCGQTAGWMKMPLSTEVDLSP